MNRCDIVLNCNFYRFTRCLNNIYMIVCYRDGHGIIIYSFRCNCRSSLVVNFHFIAIVCSSNDYTILISLNFHLRCLHCFYTCTF